MVLPLQVSMVTCHLPVCQTLLQMPGTFHLRRLQAPELPQVLEMGFLPKFSAVFLPLLLHHLQQELLQSPPPVLSPADERHIPDVAGIVSNPGIRKEHAPSLGVLPPTSTATPLTSSRLPRMLVSLHMLVVMSAKLPSRLFNLQRLPPL